MVIVMNAPLRICFSQNLLCVQSVSNILVRPSSLEAFMMSPSPVPRFLVMKYTVSTAAKIKKVVCNVSVQTTVLIPPLKV